MSDTLDLVNGLLGVHPPITEDTMNVLKDFLLLWNVYDTKFFNSDYSNKKLRLLVDSGIIQAQDIHPALSYFSHRYTSNCIVTNENFEKLHFRKNDYRKDVVNSLHLIGTVADATFAVLIIIYRLRCNLFHGLKDAASFNLQKQNFEIANRVLLEVLQR
jgi:hypothetical protein